MQSFRRKTQDTREHSRRLSVQVQRNAQTTHGSKTLPISAVFRHVNPAIAICRLDMIRHISTINRSAWGTPRIPRDIGVHAVAPYGRCKCMCNIARVNILNTNLRAIYIALKKVGRPKTRGKQKNNPYSGRSAQSRHTSRNVISILVMSKEAPRVVIVRQEEPSEPRKLPKRVLVLLTSTKMPAIPRIQNASPPPLSVDELQIIERQHIGRYIDSPHLSWS